MSSSAHLLVVRTAGLPWALPMDAVEQTFSLASYRARRIGGSDFIAFRDRVIELHDLAAALGCGEARPRAAAVVVWAGGRRQAFAVDELVGQMVLERLEVPALAHGRYAVGIALLGEDKVVPILAPGAVAGAWDLGCDRSFGFTDMQRSALLEIANIGSGHAATALSQMLGKPVDIRYAEALLATLAEAADRIGAAASQSAVVDTPLAGQRGKVLLLFPDGSGDELCALLGTSLDEEIGRSALREVGNILASSYLNAIVEMTGLELEPEPPTIEVDILGSLVETCLGGAARPSDPTVLMRSTMVVGSSDARFAFLFVPQIGAVQTLLAALGVGSQAQAA